MLVSESKKEEKGTFPQSLASGDTCITISLAGRGWGEEYQ